MKPETEALLRWYDAGHRDLPWRGTKDPYRIWVSEIMLQQTRVETVIPYYRRFLLRFPDLQSLAEADTQEVLKLWEGLGYYQRARNLQRGAREVMQEHGGELPASAAALRGISGIGPYTAGAIASFAFGLPEPAVDGNVIRVMTRLRGFRENAASPSARRRIEEETRGLMPAERPGDFNQALMDLGAGCCCPGTPDCARCPLHPFCDACQAGDAEMLPLLPDKTPPKEENWAVLLLFRKGCVLAGARKERLLQGLWCFPMLRGTPEAAELQTEIRKQWKLTARDPEMLLKARHVFTHRIWQMTVWAAETTDEAPAGCRFVNGDALRALPMPTAMKAARAEALRRLNGAGPQERADDLLK